MAQVFDIIEGLHNNGELTKLCKLGIISPTIYRYFQLEKDKRTIEKRFTRSTKGRNYLRVCELHSVSLITLHHATKLMNSPY